MAQEKQDTLHRIPIVKQIVNLLDRVKLPGLDGFSLYNLISLYVVGIAKGALTTRASAIAFSFFTAIFPFMIFILILIPYIPITDFRNEFMYFLESFLPPNTSDFFFQNIFYDIEDSNRKGLLSSVFILSIFMMANGVNAIFSGFANSYHNKLNRNFYQQYFYALGIAIVLAFLLLLTVAFIVYFQLYAIEPLIDSGYISKRDDVFSVNIAQYVFFMIMIYLSTSILYFYGTKQGRKHRFFSAGSFFTTLLIVLTSYLFGIYIVNFSTYNELYGSIGALLILLLYIWLNSIILLLGYELNATIYSLRHKQITAP